MSETLVYARCSFVSFRSPSRRTLPGHPGRRARRADGAYSFVVCLSHFTIDHAFLSRRSTVPTPSRDTSNIWVLITCSFIGRVAAAVMTLRKRTLRRGA